MAPNRIVGHLSLVVILSFLSARLGYSQSYCYDPYASTLISSYFPQCHAVTSTLSVCNALYGNQYLSCHCQQGYFNLIYGCANELDRCIGLAGIEDNSISEALSDWHTGCDTFLQSAVTTPMLTWPTVSAPPLDVCRNVDASCGEGGTSTQACKFSYRDSPEELSSCLCQPSLLSVASYCEYFGNQTCLLTSATLTNVDLFQICPMQASAFIAALNASTTTATVVLAPTSILSVSPVPQASLSVVSAGLTSASATAKPTSSTSSSLLDRSARGAIGRLAGGAFATCLLFSL